MHAIINGKLVFVSLALIAACITCLSCGAQNTNPTDGGDAGLPDSDIPSLYPANDASLTVDWFKYWKQP